MWWGEGRHRQHRAKRDLGYNINQSLIQPGLFGSARLGKLYQLWSFLNKLIKIKFP